MERARRRRDDAPTGSRWWYWLAAAPVGAGLWAVSFVWVALAVASTFGGEALVGDPLAVAFWLTASLAAVPMGVVCVLTPLATYYDARAVRDAGAAWRPDPVRWAGLALLAALTVVGTVPLAVVYLSRRHRAVGVP